MKRLFLILVIALLLAGCGPTMRFSHDAMISGQRVYVGQSMEEVRVRLGKPQMVYSYEGLPWWKYGNTTVFFRDGRVHRIGEESK